MNKNNTNNIMYTSDQERLKKLKIRAKRNGNIHQLVNVTNELGNLHFQYENYDAAIEEYMEEIEACKIIGDKLKMAIAHRRIGEIQADQAEYEEALKHQNLYLEGAQELKNELEEQRAYTTLGRTYFCLAESFVEKCEDKIKALADARKALTKSLFLCEKLTNLKTDEMNEMRGRLLLNLGLVLGAQQELEQGVDLIEKAVKIFSKSKLNEDLCKAYLSLGTLYKKLKKNKLAFDYFDLAAKSEDISMKVDAHLSKAKLFLKCGEWRNARKELVKFYPAKHLSQSLREQIIKFLRIAVVLQTGEDQLQTRKGEGIGSEFYEKLGDAAVAAHCYIKALEYYEKMLVHAEKENSVKGTSAALISLAMTYKDLGEYETALPFAKRELELCTDPSEACRSAVFLAELLLFTETTSTEVCNLYKWALKKAEASNQASQEILVLNEYLHYSKSQQSDDTEVIQHRLEQLMEKNPNIDCDVENSDEPVIGAHIDLDQLSDVETQNTDDDRINRPRRTRNQGGFTMKRNERGETPLHVACIDNKIETVEKLLNSGHPTNVRDHFGWTPLHEAANHGFLDIANLLIKAGADLDDPGRPSCGGITPLLDAASCGHFSIIRLLMKKGANIYAISKDGETVLDSLEAWRKRAGSLSVDDETEYEHIVNELLTKRVTRKRVNDATTKANTRRRKSRNNVINEDEEEDEQKVIDTPEISPAEDYKRTIDVLRNRGTLPGEVLDKSSDSEKVVAPLLDSEQILLDDWMEDDLSSSNLYSSDYIFNPFTINKRKSTDSAPTTERTTKRQRLHEDSTSIMSDNESSASTNSDIIMVSKVKHKSKKKNRQISLQSVGFSRSTVSRTPSPLCVITPPLTVQTIQPKDVRLEVLIEDKLYELQISNNVTQEWIIREIQKRFEIDTGCTPHFDLLALNGNTITSKDTLDALLSSKDVVRITSKLKKIDVPTMFDRYKKICSTSRFGIEGETVTHLKSCENSATFQLKNSKIPSEKLIPLLKTLEYQHRLQVLHLSGAALRDIGDTLGHCLARLSFLQELHLAKCDIDVSCLFKIEKLPPELRDLDVSYNPLGKEAMTQLHKLLSPLKYLQTLDLSTCGLETFIPDTCNGNLTSLNISWNHVNGEALLSLLQPHMHTINVSGSQSRSEIVAVLLDHPKFTLNTLVSLKLSCCDLRDSDLELIFQQTSNLNELMVNNNSKLTKLSVIRALQHKPTLSHIDISGCSEVKEPPDPGTSIFNPGICKLVVSMAPDVPTSWLKLWCDQALVKTLPHHVVVFQHH